MVAEPDIDVQALAELPETGHFAAPVVGQALAHEGRHLLHLPRETFQRGLRRAIGLPMAIEDVDTQLWIIDPS